MSKLIILLRVSLKEPTKYLDISHFLVENDNQKIEEIKASIIKELIEEWYESEDDICPYHEGFGTDRQIGNINQDPFIVEKHTTFDFAFFICSRNPNDSDPYTIFET